MKSLLLVISFLTIGLMSADAQNDNEMGNTSDLSYYEIPDYPEQYTPGSMVARMIDGLGYRYYWATEGLTEKDLAYEPGNDGRTAGQTIDHIYGLSRSIVNCAMKKPNVRVSEELTFAETRKKTLENIKRASDLFKASNSEDMEEFKVVFKRGDQTAEFPIWNLLNGQLADAIYHVGQIVSYRRSSGNPMDPRVNVFSGKNRE